MKKLLFFFLAIALIGCKGNEPKKPEKFKIDLDAKVYIKPDNSLLKAPQYILKSNPERLTPLEVVKQAYHYKHYNHRTSSTLISSAWHEKDTVSEVPAFIHLGVEILRLDEFGKPIINEDFIYAYDLVIIDKESDTIAYIPNSNFVNAEIQIRQALADKDTASVYDLFQNAFKFSPITGSEWLELKEQNLN